MTQDLVIVLHCDVCNAEKATTFVLDRREVELCAEHRAPVDAVLTLLTDHGRAVRKGSSVEHPGKGHTWGGDRTLAVAFRTCPLCGKTGVTRNAIAQHVLGHHERSLVEAEEGTDKKYPCPGCEETYNSFMSLSSHASRLGHSLAEVPA